VHVGIGLFWWCRALLRKYRALVVDAAETRLMRRVCRERGLERELRTLREVRTLRELRTLELGTLYHATACVSQKRRVCMNRSMSIPT